MRAIDHAGSSQSVCQVFLVRFLEEVVPFCHLLQNIKEAKKANAFIRFSYTSKDQLLEALIWRGSHNLAAGGENQTAAHLVSYLKQKR